MAEHVEKKVIHDFFQYIKMHGCHICQAPLNKPMKGRVVKCSSDTKQGMISTVEVKQQVPFQSDNLSEGDCVSFMLSSASSGMISATSISKCDPSSLSATVDIACANIGEYIAEKRVIMLSADFELGVKDFIAAELQTNAFVGIKKIAVDLFSPEKSIVTEVVPCFTPHLLKSTSPLKARVAGVIVSTKKEVVLLSSPFHNKLIIVPLSEFGDSHACIGNSIEVDVTTSGDKLYGRNVRQLDKSQLQFEDMIFGKFKGQVIEEPDEQNLYKGKVFVDVDLFSTDKLTLESMCKPTIQLAVIENDITSHDSSATKFGDENTATGKTCFNREADFSKGLLVASFLDARLFCIIRRNDVVEVEIGRCIGTGSFVCRSAEILRSSRKNRNNAMMQRIFREKGYGIAKLFSEAATIFVPFAHVFSPSSLAVGSWIECGMELTAKGPVATRVSIKDVDANQICGQVTNVSDTGCGSIAFPITTEDHNGCDEIKKKTASFSTLSLELDSSKLSVNDIVNFQILLDTRIAVNIGILESKQASREREGEVSKKFDRYACITFDVAPYLEKAMAQQFIGDFSTLKVGAQVIVHISLFESQTGFKQNRITNFRLKPV